MDLFVKKWTRFAKDIFSCNLSQPLRGSTSPRFGHQQAAAAATLQQQMLQQTTINYERRLNSRGCVHFVGHYYANPETFDDICSPLVVIEVWPLHPAPHHRLHLSKALSLTQRRSTLYVECHRHPPHYHLVLLHHPLTMRGW